MNDTDQAVDKIRKLLRLAKDQAASEGEVNNALKAARLLMDRYGVEEAEVNLGRSVDQLKDTMVQETSVQRGKVYKDETFMAHVVCAVCDVRHYVIRGRDGDQLRFYGYQRNVAIACALFTELMATMRGMARRHYGSTWGPQHKDYGLGMIHNLYQRAIIMRNARIAQPSSAGTSSGTETVSAACTAMVLKTDTVLDRMQEQLGIKMKTSRKSTIRNMDSYGQGHADGQHVSLGVNQMKKGEQAREVLQ